MKVLIIGANGKIGQKLVKKLKSSSHQPVAMYRSKSQVNQHASDGTQSVLADLEEDFEHAYDGVNAVVFTAGSGGHTGTDKTHLVDRIGAKKAIDLAVKHQIERFVLVSAFGADLSPSEWPENMKHYYEAKADADKHLMQSNLNYTILKPGRLTDEPGTNNVTLDEDTGMETGSIPRADVATVIEKSLDHPAAYHKSLELLSGDIPVDRALDELQ